MRNHVYKSGLSGLLLAALAAFSIFTIVGAEISPAYAEDKCTATNNSEFATHIAHGHAFTKHSSEFVEGVVIGGLAFPGPTIENADAFATFLAGILDNPSANKALSASRHGYWDAATGTVIITNPKPDDCGTAFRPTAGKSYYDNLT
ncbi:hypothetical protein FMN50_26085 [Rhodobacterales bacterium]|nr:hypothetical protein FMN50_26085 [Rhodobacterales bacterium]